MEESSSSADCPPVASDTLAEESSSSADPSQVPNENNAEASSSSPVRPLEPTSQPSDHASRAARGIQPLDAFAHQLEPTRSQQSRQAVQAHQLSPLASTAFGGNSLGRAGQPRSGTSPFAPVHQLQHAAHQLRDEYGSQYQPNSSRTVAPRDRSTGHIGRPNSRLAPSHRRHEERLRRHQREEHQSFPQPHQSSTQQPTERSQPSQPSVIQLQPSDWR